MPELPEVESLRRSLLAPLVGRAIRQARVHRPDVVRPTPSSARSRRLRDALLVGDVVDRLERRGKQLAIVGRRGRVICVHLGMSGQLLHVPAGRRLPRTDHVHVVWRLEREGGRLVFRDPRRFGGVWTFESPETLLSRRWRQLGPDAASITKDDLTAALASTRRPVKTVLLDQARIAGVGNIYADEALFRAGVHPGRPADTLASTAVRRLHAALRDILAEAIEAGGSTIRDYRNGRDDPGGFQGRHAVYGRAGSPCVICGATLRQASLGQRTTVWCPDCQPNRRRD